MRKKLKGQMIQTDKDGNDFDVVEWRKLSGLYGISNQLLTEILLELKKQNEILEDIRS